MSVSKGEGTYFFSKGVWNLGEKIEDGGGLYVSSEEEWGGELRSVEGRLED